MHRLLLVALAALVVPTVTPAQLQLGARLGYAIPMGDAFKDPSDGSKEKLSDEVKGAIPIQLDAAYKLSPHLAVGAYFAYGFGLVNESKALGGGVCDQSGVDCSAKTMRIGVQATWTMTYLSKTFVPWASAGAGWEWATLDIEASGLTGSYTLSGPEFLNLQLGADYKVAEKASVGPYLGLALAQYSKAEVDIPGFGSGEMDIDKTLHQWLGFGVRGTFDL